MSQPSIFITGAASGIGKETAILFASKGWRVGLSDCDLKRLMPLAKELGGATGIHAADVADAGGMRQAIIEFCGGETAPLDAIFNCAGILEMRPFAETSLKRLHAIIDINVKGVINGIHSALPNLRASSGSRVVTMCSTSALYGIPELAIYSSSKFAVRAITESLNIEFQPLGIWVTDVIVGYVRTPMVVDADRQAQSVEILGVQVEPRQVAETVFRAVTEEKQVHWFVTPADYAFAQTIDTTPWEERHKIIREITGF